MKPGHRRKTTIRAWDCRCQRCGHAWLSMAEKPPEACARCKSGRFWMPPQKVGRKPKESS